MVMPKGDQIPISAEDVQMLLERNPLAAEQVKVLALTRLLAEANAKLAKAHNEPCCHGGACSSSNGVATLQVSDASRG